jgi:hypothetical protein
MVTISTFTIQRNNRGNFYSYKEDKVKKSQSLGELRAFIFILILRYDKKAHITDAQGGNGHIWFWWSKS